MSDLHGLPMGGLILTRRAGQEVVIEIDGRIVALVELHDIPGRDRARIRVRAPSDVLVDRAEVYDRRRQAAAGGATR